jgi:hypothetical protein
VPKIRPQLPFVIFASSSANFLGLLLSPTLRIQASLRDASPTGARNPAINRRATVICPSGTRSGRRLRPKALNTYRPWGLTYRGPSGRRNPSCPNPSRCCPWYPIIPYPTGRFFRGTLSQALRARLRSVSSLRDALADISQQHLAKACCELSRRDRAIVAWHAVPGKTPPKEPSRRVRYDRVRRTTG